MPFIHALINILEDLMVFAVAIAIFGKSWYDKWLRHQERKLEIRLMKGAPIDNSETSQRLQQELDRLRDTTTQYDISIDHTLQELKDRVRYLESRTQPYSDSTTQEADHVQMRNA